MCMPLWRVIRILKHRDPSEVFAPAFGTALVYQGHYSAISFQPLETSTAGAMLKCAESALGVSMKTYHQGELEWLFDVHVGTPCYVSEWGRSSDKAGSRLVEILCQRMLGFEEYQ